MLLTPVYARVMETYIIPNFEADILGGKQLQPTCLDIIGEVLEILMWAENCNIGW